ncbi:hypothetical protein FACS1894181_11040 [Bacteroidia bacterium]|nr:hypothetical protein FACS1894181_11040 [Bacteroidia bacterium]
MNKDGHRLYSILGTVIFHLVILLILFVTVLRANVPEELTVIEVDFGGGSTASRTQGGTNTPPQPAVVPTTPPPAQPQPRNTQPPVLTQEEEESLKLAEAKRKQEAEAKRRQEAEEKRRKAEEAERARQAEQERRAQAAINNQVTGAFGRGNGSGAGQGGVATGSGQGDNPFGNGGSGSNSDGGGYGSFNLDGRSLRGGLPRPSYTVQDEGRIVIDITVDPQGNVILAEIGRGTNITNASMRQSAIEAAGKAKFNSISKTNNQRGTITYNYSLK